ncbi:HIT family protein [Salsipaludibacter albus]|uniref:HIT family protein n=1 Tax=Salsipaludibacter albus TaxID=2849650 RepID=UPI001EE3F5EC|nr:HIT domain-containing protein [Salsipaludibacter albus]MBY5163694.1 HIT domain-containing protein [Salsipaludibacter albus]
MDDCTFCRITEGSLTAHIVHEDAVVMAFLDTTPINPGHTLVVPRVHEPDFHHLPPASYRALMDVVRTIATVIDEVHRPTKVGLVVAGWDQPHAHVHVVPMHDYHDITSRALLDGHRNRTTPRELERVATHLRGSLATRDASGDA